MAGMRKWTDSRLQGRAGWASGDLGSCAQPYPSPADPPGPPLPCLRPWEYARMATEAGGVESSGAQPQGRCRIPGGRIRDSL